MKKFTALLLALVLAFSLAGCATFDNFKEVFIDDGENVTEDTPATIKFGVYEPLTGTDASGAADEIRGIELAHSLYPTVLGTDVELVYADNKSDLVAAEEAIETLVAKEPSVILGSYGSAYSLAASKHIQQAKIPTISVTNENGIVVLGNPYYFSISYSDNYEAIAAAKYLVEGAGCRFVAILKPSPNDQADTMAKGFAEKMIQLTENSSCVRLTLTYPRTAEDYSVQLQQIKSASVQAVFLPSSVEDAKRIVNQAREMGISTLFVGTSYWDSPEILNSTEKETENIAFPTAFASDMTTTSGGEAFLKAYKEAYGEDVQPSSAVAMGWDAYMLARDAIERVGDASDGEALREAIQNTAQYPGAAGSITFDVNGSPIKTVAIATVEHGAIEPIYKVEPTWVRYDDYEDED